jgi:hypothetical protein
MNVAPDLIRGRRREGARVVCERERARIKSGPTGMGERCAIPLPRAGEAKGSRGDAEERAEEGQDGQHGGRVSQVDPCRKAEFDPLLFFLHSL